MFFDRSSELWVGVVELGGPGGQRRRKIVRARKKPDMLAKMRHVQAWAQKGLPVVADDTMTTATWLRFWLDEILPGTVSEETTRIYRRRIECHVVPHVGKVPMAKLKPDHVQKMMRHLEAEGLAPATRAGVRELCAKRWPRPSGGAVSPATSPDSVKAPTVAGARTDDALDADEAARVLDAARGDRMEALAVLVLATGLRQGEALRLRWDDIDLDPATITVTKAKTAAGLRTVALPGMAVALAAIGPANARNA